MMVCGEKGERNSLALRFRVHTHTLTLAYEEGRPLFVYGRESWEIMVESVLTLTHEEAGLVVVRRKSWLKAWACASTLDAENSRCMYAVKSTTATTTRVKPPVVPLHCPNVTLHEEILIHHHRSDPARPGCAFHA